MDKATLLELADKVEAMSASDNGIDVLCEVALFRPGTCFTAVRANFAGTKVIYTDMAGNDVTCWADSWTDSDRRYGTVEALRALASQEEPKG